MDDNNPPDLYKHINMIFCDKLEDERRLSVHTYVELINDDPSVGNLEVLYSRDYDEYIFNKSLYHISNLEDSIYQEKYTMNQYVVLYKTDDSNIQMDRLQIMGIHDISRSVLNAINNFIFSIYRNTAFNAAFNIPVIDYKKLRGVIFVRHYTENKIYDGDCNPIDY